MKDRLVNEMNRIERIAFKLFSKIKREFNSKLKDSVILVGDGRSGTTWIANIINFRKDFTYLFEPFHPVNSEICKDFGMFKYLNKSNSATYYDDVIHEIITGNKRIKNKKILFVKNKRLIKSIFSHLFLKYINMNYPDLNIILLLRHPCAVANSKQKTKRWGWLKDPVEFLNQKDLVDEFLFPFSDLIKSPADYFEKQIIIWCVLHYILFKQFRKGEIHIAFYENFIVNPEEEIQKLFSFIGIDIKKPMQIETVKRAYEEKSATLRKGSAINYNKSLLDDWRNDISGEQIKYAIGMLKEFKLDKIYGYDSLANVKETYELMEK